MIINLKIAELKCLKTTDNGIIGTNQTDEVYLVVSGSTSYSTVERPRIDPSGSATYYRLRENDSEHGINLWTDSLLTDQSAYFTIIVREDDDGGLRTIGNLLKNAGQTVFSIISGGDPLGAGLSGLVNASKDLVKDLSRDNDQTIGAFAVSICFEGGNLISKFHSVHAQTVIENPNSPPTIRMRGANSNYLIRLDLQQLRLPMLIAKHSNKALDVVNASLADQANVQQFTIHGRPNQRWYLRLMGTNGFPSYNRKIQAGLPYYAILCEQSGKALDVVGGSMQNGANVQQFNPNYGLNQLWAMQHLGNNEYAILNMKSGKALTVRGSSVNDGGNVVQDTFRDTDNQKWKKR